MTPETIAVLIASFGAIMAALFGIWRASGGGGAVNSSSEQPKDLPGIVNQYLDVVREIDRELNNAVQTLSDIRRALEGTGHRQEKMVEELENMARSMSRLELGQGSAAQHVAAMKHHHEMMVQILAQVREELKGLRGDGYVPHRSR